MMPLSPEEERAEIKYRRESRTWCSYLVAVALLVLASILVEVCAGAGP